MVNFLDLLLDFNSELLESVEFRGSDVPLKNTLNEMILGLGRLKDQMNIVHDDVMNHADLSDFWMVKCSFLIDELQPIPFLRERNAQSIDRLTHLYTQASPSEEETGLTHPITIAFAMIGLFATVSAFLRCGREKWQYQTIEGEEGL